MSSAIYFLVFCCDENQDFCHLSPLAIYLPYTTEKFHTRPNFSSCNTNLNWWTNVNKAPGKSTMYIDAFDAVMSESVQQGRNNALQAAEVIKMRC